MVGKRDTISKLHASYQWLVIMNFEFIHVLNTFPPRQLDISPHTYYHGRNACTCILCIHVAYSSYQGCSYTQDQRDGLGIRLHTYIELQCYDVPTQIHGLMEYTYPRRAHCTKLACVSVCVYVCYNSSVNIVHFYIPS